MKRVVKLCVALLISLPLVAQAAMISFDELQAEIKSNKNLVVIGIDKAGGKIAGSSALDYKRVRKDSNTLSPADFEALMQEMGVSNNSKVVIVEEGVGGGTFAPAARLYWNLKYYGFENVAILSGGLQEWEDMGGATVATPAKVKKGDFKVKGTNDTIYTSNDQMKDLVGKATVIDVRPISDYMGLTHPKSAKKAGHIDGAKTADMNIYMKSGSNLHSKADLEALFADLKIDLSKEVVTYCNTGNQAAVAWFVISEVLGKKARVYDGSMKEWDGAVSTKIQN